MTMSQLYVALGDSISIDDYAGGHGRGGASLLFRNRDDDFPEWAGRDLRSAGFDRMLMLAADGAIAEDVEVQVDRLVYSGLSPDVMTVTFAGNDLMGVITGWKTVEQTMTEVAKRGAAFLGRLRQNFPQAQVIVGTIYDPTDGTARSGDWLPEWPEGVSVLAEFNSLLKRLANDEGYAVADIHGRFLGHGVTVGDIGQPDARPADRALFYTRAIEPNAWGASEVRAAFWDAVQ